MAEKLLHKNYKVTKNFNDKLKHLVALEKEKEEHPLNQASILDDMINEYYANKMYRIHDKDFAPITRLYVMDAINTSSELMAKFHNSLLDRMLDEIESLNKRIESLENR